MNGNIGDPVNVRKVEGIFAEKEGQRAGIPME